MRTAHGHGLLLDSALLVLVLQRVHLADQLRITETACATELGQCTTRALKRSEKGREEGGREGRDRRCLSGTLFWRCSCLRSYMRIRA